MESTSSSTSLTGNPLTNNNNNTHFRNLPTLKDFAVTTTPETPLPADPSKQGIEWSQNSDIEFLTTQNFGQINKGDWLVALYVHHIVINY